jgi:hypothetical protein
VPDHAPVLRARTDGQSVPQPCHRSGRGATFVCAVPLPCDDPESAERGDGSLSRAPSSRLRFAGPVTCGQPGCAHQLSILSDRKQLRSRIKDLPLAASIASAVPAGSAGISLPDPTEIATDTSRQPPSEVARVAIAWSKHNLLIVTDHEARNRRPGLAHRPAGYFIMADTTPLAAPVPEDLGAHPEGNDHIWVVDASRIEGGGAYLPLGG